MVKRDYNYFKQAGAKSYQELDGWVRTRLRSILKEHVKGRAVERGIHQKKYPNIYFAALDSLFSLEQTKITELCIWKQNCLMESRAR